MWVFLSDSFLSIVAHRERADALLVRARLPGDIEAVFPGAEVAETNAADYRFRAVVDRADVGRALADAALSIDYDNFKGSVSVTNGARNLAYHQVWSVMQGAQNVAPSDDLGLRYSLDESDLIPVDVFDAL